jgi:glycosyltransferase involved in cell wall biosynthesis
MYRQWDMTLPVTLNTMDMLHDRYRFDYVWGHYLFPAGFTAVYWGKLHAITSIVSVRGNDLDRGIFPPADFARLGWTLQTADRVTCVSADLAQKIAIISNRQDTIVIKNAVDTETFHPDCVPIPRAELGISDDALILGFVGELREKKGQQYLLQAWTKLRPRLPVHLLIIGEVRPTPDSPLLSMDTTGLIITGHISDRALVARYLKACDLFLLPSLWEGLPNALLEAMSSGLCCLASDAGGIPEVMEHGKEGFILKRSQLDYLDVAISEFFQMSLEQRQTIGQCARQRILREFSPASEAQRLCALFG